MGPSSLRPSKASGKGRLGEPHYDGNVRKGRDRGTHEAAQVRRDRRVRPAGIRARGWAGVPVRAGERRPGEATETSRGGIRRGVPYLGEGRQGARPGDWQRPQSEGRDRDEVRRTPEEGDLPALPFFWQSESQLAHRSRVPEKAFCPSAPSCLRIPGRMHRHVFAFSLGILLAFATVNGPSPASAAAQKPTYAPGDRWIYDLRGSLESFPGVNASDVGTFSFGLLGRVDTAVAGTESAVVGGQTVPAVRVDTRTTGFLNGTFSAPGLPGDVSVTGSFTSAVTELWETQAYLPVASMGTTTYLATLSYIVSIDISAGVRVNATTAYASIPPFDLGVGNASTAAFTSHLIVNTTVSGFGAPLSSENETTVAGNWTRQNLAATTVTVDAGTFAVGEMNQTVTSFAGLAGIVPTAGANETAYFSSVAGNYVKRDAYANGTHVAGLTLESYTYGTRSADLFFVDVLLLVLVPIAALLIVLFAPFLLQGQPLDLRFFYLAASSASFLFSVILMAA